MPGSEPPSKEPLESLSARLQDSESPLQDGPFPQSRMKDLSKAAIAWINLLELDLSGLRDSQQDQEQTGNEEQAEGESTSESKAPNSKKPKAIQDYRELRDGILLGMILESVDPLAFPTPHRHNQGALRSKTPKLLADNWVLRHQHLRRIARGIVGWFRDNHQQIPGQLPDLALIAQSPDPEIDNEEEGELEVNAHEIQTTKFVSLILTVCVMTSDTEVRERFVSGLRGLNEWVQRELMGAIEEVQRGLLPIQPVTVKSGAQGDPSLDIDSVHPNPMSNETPWTQKPVEEAYEGLMKSFLMLKTQYEEAQSNIQSLTTERNTLAELNRDLNDNEHEGMGLNDGDDDWGKRSIKARQDDHDREQQEEIERELRGLRAEIERVRFELQRSETERSEMETQVEQQNKTIEEMNKQTNELTTMAEEAHRLKDTLDEYKHAAEKGKKLENVVDKYKKKLEEAAEIKKGLKALEDENASLLDRNTALEEEYKKVASFKPLMENYKAQLDNMDVENSNLRREQDTFKSELSKLQSKLQEERESATRKDEMIELLEERVAELEAGIPKRAKSKTFETKEEEEQVAATEELEDASAETIAGVGGEINDAISGVTSTDLKLKIRKLERELAAATMNKADSSRILVLENLLEDSKRMKERYEKDWMAEHREKVALKTQVEEIMSGKSGFGEGPEAVIALRLRLNQTVEDLDASRRENAELSVKNDSLNKDLIVVKSDLNLVNKDQLDILSTLRTSVSVEKTALEREVERLKNEITISEDRGKSLLKQVNGLLMEKVNFQTDSIDVRERMLVRERDLKSGSTGTSKSLSNEENSKLEGYSRLQDEVRDLSEKLRKAKDFIKNQDKLFKARQIMEHSGNSEELEQTYKAQISQHLEEIDRLKYINEELETRYQREQQLMLSAWHEQKLRSLREQMVKKHTNGVFNQSNSSNNPIPSPVSFLAVQRQRTFQDLRKV